MDHDNCPVCYEPIADINVSITKCNHRFHTSCLLLCKGECPMCRSVLVEWQTTNGHNMTVDDAVIIGTYTYKEFINIIEEKKINIEDLAPHTQAWLEECKEYYDSKIQLENMQKKRAEKEMDDLKNRNPAKFELFSKKR